MFRKGTLSGFHTPPPHPEDHADQAQYETDPLLDNNNQLGLSTFLFASSLFLHTLPDTQSAVAAEVSNFFLKTGGAAIIALNRGMTLVANIRPMPVSAIMESFLKFYIHTI